MYEIQPNVFIAHAHVVTVNKFKKTIHMVNGFTYNIETSDEIDSFLDEWNKWFKCE